MIKNLTHKNNLNNFNYQLFCPVFDDTASIYKIEQKLKSHIHMCMQITRDIQFGYMENIFDLLSCKTIVSFDYLPHLGTVG